MEEKMTTLRPETTGFLAELESFSGRKFSYKEEIGSLIDESRASGRMQVFEDLVFFAKFLSKSFDIMKRIGPDGEGYGKIAGEFQSTVEKSATLMKTLVKDSPQELKQRFTGAFFRLDPENLSALMNLMRELAWVKNWMIDGRQLP